MKWVKSEEEIKRYLKNKPREDWDRLRKNLFYNSDSDENKGKIFMDEYATYRDTDRFHRWGYEVELRGEYNPEEVLKEYELHAGGWIDFWDTEVRQDSTDHALYFKEHICNEERSRSGQEQREEAEDSRAKKKSRRYVTAYIMQLNPPEKIKFNVYVNVSNPPTSDPPPPPPPGKW